MANEYIAKTVTEWKAPEKIDEPDPRILTMPNIVHALQGCLEGEAEVLTPNGWRRIDSVSIGDSVMCWAEGCLFFDAVQNTIETDVETAYRIGFKKANNFDMLYSPGHRIPMMETLYTWGKNARYKYEQPKKILRVKTAEEYKPDSGKKFITAARGTGENVHLTANERVLIAIQADGCLLHKNQDGTYVYYVSLKKARKISRIRKLLNESSLRWTEGDHDNEHKGYRIWLDKEAKTFENVFTWNMPYTKAREFIQELWEWDGYVGLSSFGTQRSCYTSSRYDNISFVQAIAAQAGYTTNTRKDIRSNTISSDGVKHGDCWTIEFIDKMTRGCGHTKKEAILYNGKMYCITVPSSFFLVKYHDIVMITGNSGCQPRTIAGPARWNIMRKKCYMDAHYKCEACGKDVSGRGEAHAHELFSTDYAKGTSTFERLVCLCPCDHIRFIHSGRMMTLLRKNSVQMPKVKALEGIEHGFKLISDYNKNHYEPIYPFSAFLEGLTLPIIADELKALIEKYDMKFYGHIGKESGLAPWPVWKMIWNGKEYKTPYADPNAWEIAMKEQHPEEPANPFSGGVFDEIDKILKEV